MDSLGFSYQEKHQHIQDLLVLLAITNRPKVRGRMEYLFKAMKPYLLKNRL